MKVQLKEGMVIGNRALLKEIKRGPYTYYLTRCLCRFKTKTVVSAARICNGQAQSCNRCFLEGKKHALKRYYDERAYISRSIKQMFKG